MSNIIGELEIGKFRPSRFDIERERRQEAEEQERANLRKLALAEAMLTARRDRIARKMYHGEAISLEDWPALGALAPVERTRILADVRRAFGFPAEGKP